MVKSGFKSRYKRYYNCLRLSIHASRMTSIYRKIPKDFNDEKKASGHRTKYKYAQGTL